MSVGRRSVLLPPAFLGLAVVFTSFNSALAQQGVERPHTIWAPTLSADQIKAALAHLRQEGEGDQDPLQKMIREQLGKQFPNVPQETLDAFIKKSLADPKIMEMARRMAKE